MVSIARIIWLSLAAALAGCAASSSRPLPESRPPDFALGLTVYAPEGPVRRPGQQAARYTVGPDAWLRAAVGAGVDASTFPPIARRLSHDQRERLWDGVRRAGVERVPPALRLTSPELFDAPSGRRVYLVELTTGSARHAVALPEGEPEAEAFADLADLLADWAWVRP